MEYSNDKYDVIEYCFPQSNLSCTRKARTRNDYVVMYVFFSSISVFTVFVNLLVIISICHFKQLQTPTNIFILSMAVADLFIGGIVMPVESMRLVESCWFLGESLCNFYPAVMTILVSASLGHLVFIAVDRYLAVCEPFFYASTMTVGKSVACIVICWLSSALYNLTLLNVNENMNNPHRQSSCVGECLLLIDFTWGMVDVVISFILPCSILFTLYLIIFFVARNQARVINAQSGNMSNNAKCVISKSSDRKAAKTLGIVIFVYLLGWIPYYISILTQESTSVAVYVLSWLMYINSFVNPLIYALFYPWFKVSVRHIVTLKILHTSSSHLHLLPS
ncbi:trace amine-associated receptor 13c-like [Alosa alosa]|uniref:trace amine-associated receptor 13c-like n=1 Tax=Alosa sapidissima TaxID=34773 RepID=UPI001C09396D|nr:trace amine-associated receptor 13c-like [Alosa sapidissima]XP_048122717.1 trace amine-associated receptor 13c-like [Alosa alosa]